MLKNTINRAMRRARSYVRSRKQRKFWGARNSVQHSAHATLRSSARDILSSGLVTLSIWDDGQWRRDVDLLEAESMQIQPSTASIECDVDLELLAHQEQVFNEALPEWAKGLIKLRGRATLTPEDAFDLVPAVSVPEPKTLILSLSDESLRVLAKSLPSRMPE